MKKLLVVISIFIYTCSFAQQNSDPWEKFTFLLGSWKGEGSGKPGEGEGTFSFNLDLDKNILIRTSHSIYPAGKDKPETIHDDLMITYFDSTGMPGKAIYFDNEGHVINYSVNVIDKHIVFSSEIIQGQPAFRLSYTSTGNSEVNTKFEVSRDGRNFFTYIEGISQKMP